MFIKVIPQGHCSIVMRFGKPVRVATSGLNFFVPFFDSLKDCRQSWGEETNKNGVYIELSEQITDTRPRECFTKDNVKLIVNCAIRWRVTNPVSAVFEVDHLHQSLRESVLAEIRSFVGSHELNFVLSSRQQISEHVAAGVSDTVKRWGINIVGAEIQELTADDATVDAMRQQLEASRRSEALKLEAVGKAEAMVREAQAAKDAAILHAQGQSEAVKLMAEGDKTYLAMLVDSVGKESAAQILIAQKTLKAYEAIVKDPANKVFLPLTTMSAGLIAESHQEK